MKSETDAAMREKRRSNRFSLQLDMEYRTMTQNPIYGNVMIDNISRGGLAFSKCHGVKTGTTVQLKMNVPGDNLPVFATGMVAWADGIRAGVRLTKISKRDQERVLECVYQSWLKNHHLNTKRSVN